MPRRYKQNGEHFEEVHYKDLFKQLYDEQLRVEAQRKKGVINEAEKIVEFDIPNNEEEFKKCVHELITTSEKIAKTISLREADKYAKIAIQLQIVGMQVNNALNKLPPVPELDSIKTNIAAQLKDCKTDRADQLKNLIDDLKDAETITDMVNKLAEHYSKVMLSGGAQINLGFAKIGGSELAKRMREVCQEELGILLPKTLENNKQLTSDAVGKTDKYYLLTGEAKPSPRKEKR